MFGVYKQNIHLFMHIIMLILYNLNTPDLIAWRKKIIHSILLKNIFVSSQTKKAIGPICEDLQLI